MGQETQKVGATQPTRLIHLANLQFPQFRHHTLRLIPDRVVEHGVCDELLRALDLGGCFPRKLKVDVPGRLLARIVPPRIANTHMSSMYVAAYTGTVFSASLVSS